MADFDRISRQEVHEIVRKCLLDTCECLELTKVLVALKSGGFLTQFQAEKIKVKETTYERNEEFMDTLPKLQNGAFECFLAALNASGQDRLLDLFLNKCGQDKDLRDKMGKALGPRFQDFLKDYYKSKKFSMQYPLSDEFAFNLEENFSAVAFETEDKIIFDDHCELITKIFSEPETEVAVISGVAGTGKTTLMRRVALDWANGKLSQYSFVFFAEFRHCRGTFDTVKQILLNYWKPLLNERITENNFEKPNMLVLLDGYDEAAAGQCAQIDQLCDTSLPCPQLNFHLVLTSRPYKITEVLRHRDPCITIKALGLNNATKKILFIERHFRRTVSKDEVHDSVSNVQQKLNDNYSLMDLADVPLFLNFICLLHRELLSGSFLELYEKIVIWMLDRLQRKNKSDNVPQRFGYQPISNEPKIILRQIRENWQHFPEIKKLGSLACEIQNEEISEKDLEKLEIFDYKLFVSAGFLLQHEKDLMETVFYFPHSTFKDYFAALFVCIWHGPHFNGYLDQRIFPFIYRMLVVNSNDQIMIENSKSLLNLVIESDVDECLPFISVLNVLQNCPNLKSIEIRGSDKQTYPKSYSFRNFTSLESLRLDNFSLRDDCHGWQLPADLKELGLLNCLLNGTFCLLRQYQWITNLYLASCTVSREYLQSFYSQFTSLRILEVHNCDYCIVNFLPVSVTSLCLTECEFHDSINREIEMNKTVKNLSIWGEYFYYGEAITYIPSEFLAHFIGIEQLELNCAILTNRISLSNFSSLSQLTLHKIDIKSTCFFSFPDSLSSVSLEYCRWEHQTEQNKKVNTSVRMLEIKNVIADKTFDEISFATEFLGNFIGITQLILKQLNTTIISNISLTNCSNLFRLSLHNLKLETRYSLLKFPESLKFLSIKDCSWQCHQELEIKSNLSIETLEIWNEIITDHVDAFNFDTEFLGHFTGITHLTLRNVNKTLISKISLTLLPNLFRLSLLNLELKTSYTLWNNFPGSLKFLFIKDCYWRLRQEQVEIKPNLSLESIELCSVGGDEINFASEFFGHFSSITELILKNLESTLISQFSFAILTSLRRLAFIKLNVDRICLLWSFPDSLNFIYFEDCSFENAVEIFFRNKSLVDIHFEPIFTWEMENGVNNIDRLIFSLMNNGKNGIISILKTFENLRHLKVSFSCLWTSISVHWFLRNERECERVLMKGRCMITENINTGFEREFAEDTESCFTSSKSFTLQLNMLISCLFEYSILNCKLLELNGFQFISEKGVTLSMFRVTLLPQSFQFKPLFQNLKEVIFRNVNVIQASEFSFLSADRMPLLSIFTLDSCSFSNKSWLLLLTELCENPSLRVLIVKSNCVMLPNTSDNDDVYEEFLMFNFASKRLKPLAGNTADINAKIKSNAIPHVQTGEKETISIRANADSDVDFSEVSADTDSICHTYLLFFESNLETVEIAASDFLNRSNPVLYEQFYDRFGDSV